MMASGALTHSFDGKQHCLLVLQASDALFWSLSFNIITSHRHTDARQTCTPLPPSLPPPPPMVMLMLSASSKSWHVACVVLFHASTCNRGPVFIEVYLNGTLKCVCCVVFVFVRYFNVFYMSQFYFRNYCASLSLPLFVCTRSVFCGAFIS